MNFFIKNKKIITIFSLTILICILGVIFTKQKLLNEGKQIKISSLCGSYERGEIKFGSTLLNVDISDTECKEILGLSGRKSLENNEGMFFIFSNLGNYGFWMRDMNFPIDIIWLNNDFVITGIEKNLNPNTYPKIYGQKYFAKYVLEVPSGYSDKNNLKVGDKIIYSKKTL